MALINTLPLSHVQHIKSRSSVRVVQVGHVQNPQIQHGTRMSCAPYSWICSQNMWCVKLWASLRTAPRHNSNSQFAIFSAQVSPPAKDVFRAVAISCTRVLTGLKACPLLLNTAPAIGLLLFTTHGLLPFMQLIRRCLVKDQDLYKSQMKHILISYVRPLLLWIGVISICRAFDPVVLSSATSQVIKERLINFVRSLSTVLAFALCTTNLVQQVQKSMEKPDADKGRNLGIQFIGNAVCTSVWVAAVCLFMELLGFSTQKWITAGGFGTVLVTLSGREIFTNFLSSVMIHATRPFIENQWIQAKIEGQEISGTVEHVGWWSPTVVRGDDREAVHIPNHKFTVSVVRNLSQKTHWRIKTHLAISHLDVGKITLIVSDMRKVLAKQSQVEHKRLHRRVFLDYIHPENQALLILVSCFVKTSHFEEYLRVKETVLLDLLKVISHHNARLATPIRSMQRVSADDSHQSAVRNERPLFLPESSIFPRSDEAQPARDYKLSRSKSQSETLTGKAESVVDDLLSKSRASGGKNDLTSKSQLEGLDSMGLNSKDITLLGAAFEKPPVKIPVDSETQPGGETNESIEGRFRKDAEDFDADDLIEDSSQIKRGKIFVQDHVKEQIVESIRSAEEKKATTSRPQSVQDNLVLGVVLDGAKRTLPLDSKMSSSEHTRNGNGNSGSRERAEMPKPASSSDGRERER